MSLAVIETRGLTKMYGRNRGILDLDLEVRAGEIFGFLGPNGSGKTTTIRTLLGFLRPTRGTARVFGLDSVRDAVAIHAQVGDLPGEFNFTERMTGEELLRYYARLRGVGDLSYAWELSERLGAEVGRPTRQLSRGNKQKIGLIQAMFHRPPLLMLDEPTNGLDPLVQEELHTILTELRARGHTIFFSSHVLSEVEELCDHVGIVREGRLVALETTRSLLTRRQRHVRIMFATQVDPAPFVALPRIKDLRVERVDGQGTVLTMVLLDDLDALIKLAAQYRVCDMELPRATLEEVFLSYYGPSAAERGQESGVEGADTAEGGVAPGGGERP